MRENDCAIFYLDQSLHTYCPPPFKINVKKLNLNSDHSMFTTNILAAFFIKKKQKKTIVHISPGDVSPVPLSVDKRVLPAPGAPDPFICCHAPEHAKPRGVPTSIELGLKIYGDCSLRNNNTLLNIEIAKILTQNISKWGIRKKFHLS